ncbi:MAG: ParB/RepB/Spo0J family partition protein [Gammaproteobacteria bacterium]|nr:ParB/RepB/Spo0J family partition protein [Gammaproteobacteria bacterium]MCH9764244.1 ParB/RepB/Spo0J family partition protein [Gammaproteobacteria bacterium]
MSAKRAGLGRNLSALLKQADEGIQAADTTKSPQALLMLPVGALQPGTYQPRGAMDESALEALASSIEQQGILQPIVVRQLKDKQYEIIAGERRWRASQMAKLTEVPVIVHDVNDETAMALALIENLQREALNVMDEARAMHRLSHEFSLTHQDIAQLLSKSRAAVSNCLRLLQLAAPVMVLLEQSQLDMGHARCLLKLEPAEQIRVADLVVSRGLSVREVEALVARLKLDPSEEKTVPEAAINPAFNNALKQASTYLGANVRLKSNRTGRGRLMIDFKSTQQLEQLLSRLSQNAEEAVL